MLALRWFSHYFFTFEFVEVDAVTGYCCSQHQGFTKGFISIPVQKTIMACWVNILSYLQYYPNHFNTVLYFLITVVFYQLEVIKWNKTVRSSRLPGSCVWSQCCSGFSLTRMGGSSQTDSHQMLWNCLDLCWLTGILSYLWIGHILSVLRLCFVVIQC